MAEQRHRQVSTGVGEDVTERRALVAEPALQGTTADRQLGGDGGDVGLAGGDGVGQNVAYLPGDGPAVVVDAERVEVVEHGGIRGGRKPVMPPGRWPFDVSEAEGKPELGASNRSGHRKKPSKRATFRGRRCFTSTRVGARSRPCIVRAARTTAAIVATIEMSAGGVAPGRHPLT